jgi:ArsR family transcriptional regulator
MVGGRDPVHDRALELLRAMAHRGRFEVLVSLREHERLCVGDLAARCGAEQSAMSHQLRVLREAGLVRAERVGKHVHYRLADTHVAHIVGDALLHASELLSDGA